MLLKLAVPELLETFLTKAWFIIHQRFDRFFQTRRLSLDSPIRLSLTWSGKENQAINPHLKSLNWIWSNSRYQGHNCLFMLSSTQRYKPYLLHLEAMLDRDKNEASQLKIGCELSITEVLIKHKDGGFAHSTSKYFMFEAYLSVVFGAIPRMGLGN